MTSSTLSSAPSRMPKFRDAIGELHAVEVVATRADAAEEDQFHRAERLEHGLQLGRLATDFGRQRLRSSGRNWARRGCRSSIPRRIASLLPGSGVCSLNRSGDFRNPTRKFLLDRLCPGRADPRREPGALHRLVQLEPASPWPGRRAGKQRGHHGSLAKASTPCATTSNFGRPVSCDVEPFTVAGDGEHAVRRQIGTQPHV